MAKKLIDKTHPQVPAGGVGNTLLSMALMFLLEGLGYWPSTAIAYVAGAVMSFFLNRHFTFHSEETLGRSAVKFAVNVAVCYVVGYRPGPVDRGWAAPPDCRPGGVVGAVLQAGGHGALHRPQLLRTAVFCIP